MGRKTSIIFLVCLLATTAHAQPAPPAGFQWQQTFNDDFNSLDTAKWNGSYAGTLWCGAEPNTVPGGPGGCAQNYFGVSVAGGVLQLAGAPNQSNFANTSNRAVINTSGKFAQRYGYFEFRAQMPHDTSGEGDGLWPGLWFLPVGKADQSGGGCCHEEPDLLEMDLSTTDMAVAHFTIHDSVVNEFSVNYPNVSAGDLSAGYHTYGLWWKKDTSPHGTMCNYFDGVQQACHTLTAPDTLWDNGIYILEQVIPCPPNDQSIFGGASCTTRTSSSNPMFVDYTRVYQLVPTTSSNPFVALIGSSFVIDGGFWSSFWGFPPDARVYQNNQPNTSQQYTFAPVSGGYSICNTANPACLTDGADNLVQQGQGTDTWAVTPNGSGWSIRNTRTNRYMGAIPSVAQANVPMSATAVAEPLTLVSGSLPTPTPTPTLTPTPTPTATPTPTGESPNCTTITTVGPAITDAVGNHWSMTASGSVAENGITDTSTFNVVKLVYSSQFVYQQNTAGNWYRRNATTGWMGVAAPVCGILGWTPSTDDIVSGSERFVFGVSASAPRANLYLDNTLVASFPPSIWDWDTTKVPNGQHTIREDDLNQNGVVVYSSSATVTVSN